MNCKVGEQLSPKALNKYYIKFYKVLTLEHTKTGHRVRVFKGLLKGYSFTQGFYLGI